MSQPHFSPEQQPSNQRQIPSIEAIGPVVDEVIDIARRELKHPIKVRLWTWEDREFKVRVKHWYPAGANNQYGYEAIIQYHSDREVVEGFFAERDTETDELEVLLETEFGRIPDPVEKKRVV